MRKKAISPVADLFYDRYNGILFIKVFEDVEMTSEGIIKHYEIIKELTQNRPYAALIDAEYYFTIDNDTLKLSASPEVFGNRIATAHYSYNLANRLTTHFFKNNIKPPIPIEYFKTKRDALSWIKKRIAEFETINKTKLVY